jgi:hypothetical protein
MLSVHIVSADIKYEQVVQIEAYEASYGTGVLGRSGKICWESLMQFAFHSNGLGKDFMGCI